MLKAAIEDIRSRIKRDEYKNENAVRQGIVLRILSVLSQPTYDTKVVFPEYPVEGRRVDYALCHPPGRPVVFIEVKSIGQIDGGDRQLFAYAFHRGVPMAILTDGREWHFYLPAGEGDYRDRCVYMLDISAREVEEIIARFRRYLHYDMVISRKAIEAARSDYEDLARQRLIRQTIPKAWDKLVEEEDEFLIEVIAERAESLCGYKPEPDMVIEFLKQRPGEELLEPSQPASSPMRPTSHQQQPAVTTHHRMRGQTGFTLDGKFYPARNARDVLVKVFIELARRDSTFLARFAALPRHGRKRRYLARTQADLYPGRPDLYKHSEEIMPGWWLGVNLSKDAIKRIIKMACDVAHLRYGHDLIVHLD